MPSLFTFLNRTPLFKWYMVRCGCKKGYQKDVFKRDWVTRSNYVYHSRFNNQHNCEDLYDYLISTKIFTLIMNKICIWAPKFMRKVAMASVIL